MRVLPVLLGIGMVAGAVAVAGAVLMPRVDGGAERVMQSGAIRIGYAWEPPYAYRDADGRVTGESPEVARAVLERMGIREAQWVQTDFANLIVELRAGRFDMIAAGMFVTAERAQRISFSSPSACIEPALLVRRGNPLDLHSLQEVAAHSSARLAVLSGAVEARDAVEAAVPSQRIHSFAAVKLAVDALEGGVVDALALSGPAVRFLAASSADLERASPFRGSRKTSGCSAFGFRREDLALRNRFDGALRSFVGSTEHRQLAARFGFAPDNLPQGRPVPAAAP